MGGSFYKPLGFYLNQEKKSVQDKELQVMFNTFMQEYIDLDHME